MSKANNNTNDEDLSMNQKEFIDFLEKASNQDIDPEVIDKNLKKDNVIHLNSLITKNISLFTKNPNYKMLAWLLTQLTIFSLFILTVTIFREYLIPYLNSL